MCMNIDSNVFDREAAIRAARPTKTASDLADFIERNNLYMDGSSPEGAAELRPMAAEILAEATKRLAYAVVSGEGEKIQHALIDQTFALAVAGFAFDLPFGKLVDATVREYERREEASKQRDPLEQLIEELSAALGIA